MLGGIVVDEVKERKGMLEKDFISDRFVTNRYHGFIAQDVQCICS